MPSCWPVAVHTWSTSAAPPSPSSRCFNMDAEGTSAHLEHLVGKWVRRLEPPGLGVGLRAL